MEKPGLQTGQQGGRASPRGRGPRAQLRGLTAPEARHLVPPLAFLVSDISTAPG